MGAFVGLAVGDAVGTTLEFKSRDSYRHITDMVGGGPFGLAPGEWTDDTSMALCLAESLIATGKPDGSFDAADLMRRFFNWWRHGYCSHTGSCFDIGTATRNALHKFEISGNPISGNTNEYSAGNGSIMRLAPVVLRYAGNREAAIAAARLQSITTHGATACVDGCILLTHLLWSLAKGLPLQEALRTAPEMKSPEIRELALGAFVSKDRSEIRSTGYVVHTLEAALWAVWHSGDPEEAVLLAANLGDDADTVAAVSGQIAGAIWGYSSMPGRWLDALVWGDRIEALAEDLIYLAESN
jgi:ADP-ribosyl-[dinitrogen reductase] hydrolase